jgi:hypothetical protein
MDFFGLAKEMGLYVHSSTICTSLFHSEKDQHFKIYWQEGISHSTLGWLPLLKDSDSLFLTTLPWFHDESQFIKQAQYVRQVASANDAADPVDRFVVLCHAPEEVDFAHRAGFRNAILCNHNAFLDPAIYSYDERSNEDIRSYDLVLNCRPERWKRPFFAAGVSKLAIIRGHNFRPHDYFDLSSLNPAYINSVRLSPTEVVGLLNSSRVGGIFSLIEGGCYSSSEYLLCGLPVVSSQSKGGRDVWYDTDNSVLVNEPSDVAPAVLELAERCRRNPELRGDIRRRHLAIAREMQGQLIAQVERIALKSKVSLNFRPIFSANFRNKITQYQSVSR